MRTPNPNARGQRPAWIKPSGGARDVALALVCVLALFALPPLFRSANRPLPPETFVLRDVATLRVSDPPPDPHEPVEQATAADRPANPLPLDMPSPAAAPPEPPPLLADWTPALPSLSGHAVMPFPVAAWEPGDIIFDEDDVDTPPRPLTQPPPRYPPGALRAGLEGEVGVEAVVLRDGSVDQIQITRESPPGVFGRAARAAVQSWRFEPARHRAQPVNARVRVTLEFQLDR